MKQSTTLVITLLLAPLAAVQTEGRPPSDFQSLVRTETWTEVVSGTNGTAGCVVRS